MWFTTVSCNLIHNANNNNYNNNKKKKNVQEKIAQVSVSADSGIENGFELKKVDCASLMLTLP